jgi:hypothetical protein
MVEDVAILRKPPSEVLLKDGTRPRVAEDPFDLAISRNLRVPVRASECFLGIGGRCCVPSAVAVGDVGINEPLTPERIPCSPRKSSSYLA